MNFLNQPSSVQFVSYWETAQGLSMPPYVALSIVSMKRALGNSFLLLTPKSVPALIGSEYLKKSWGFSQLNFRLESNIESIIAKSDFIRMAYIYQYGGVWVDADTLMLKDPTATLFPKGLTEKLHWYSEALFGSLLGNSILNNAIGQSLRESSHNWGNPGGIKTLVAQRPEQLTIIPSSIVDPGCLPLYNFATCDVMRRSDVSVAEFLLNDIHILKLYNTYFTRTTSKQQSVEEFLNNGSLLANLFLHIEPDSQFWITQSEKLFELCSTQ